VVIVEVVEEVEGADGELTALRRCGQGVEVVVVEGVEEVEGADGELTALRRRCQHPDGADQLGWLRETWS
jgi:hypothetical protein